MRMVPTAGAAPTANPARPARRLAAILAAAALAIALPGCGSSVPADPDGTLARVEGGALRVGLSPEPGLAETAGGDPSGPLVDAVEHVASRLGAEPEWTVRGEESLVGMLERGDLDLAVGSFTEETPWSERVGVSRAFEGLPGAEGRRVVVLVPMGENAFLSEIERGLDAEDEESGS